MSEKKPSGEATLRKEDSFKLTAPETACVETWAERAFRGLFNEAQQADLLEQMEQRDFHFLDRMAFLAYCRVRCEMGLSPSAFVSLAVGYYESIRSMRIPPPTTVWMAGKLIAFWAERGGRLSTTYQELLGSDPTFHGMMIALVIVVVFPDEGAEAEIRVRKSYEAEARESPFASSTATKWDFGERIDTRRIMQVLGIEAVLPSWTDMADQLLESIESETSAITLNKEDREALAQFTEEVEGSVVISWSIEDGGANLVVKNQFVRKFLPGSDPITQTGLEELPEGELPRIMMDAIPAAYGHDLEVLSEAYEKVTSLWQDRGLLEREGLLFALVKLALLVRGLAVMLSLPTLVRRSFEADRERQEMWTFLGTWRESTDEVIDWLFNAKMTAKTVETNMVERGKSLRKAEGALAKMLDFFEQSGGSEAVVGLMRDGVSGRVNAHNDLCYFIDNDREKTSGALEYPSGRPEDVEPSLYAEAVAAANAKIAEQRQELEQQAQRISQIETQAAETEKLLELAKEDVARQVQSLADTRTQLKALMDREGYRGKQPLAAVTASLERVLNRTLSSGKVHAWASVEEVVQADFEKTVRAETDLAKRAPVARGKRDQLWEGARQANKVLRKVQEDLAEVVAEEFGRVISSSGFRTITLADYVEMVDSGRAAVIITQGVEGAVAVLSPLGKQERPPEAISPWALTKATHSYLKAAAGGSTTLIAPDTGGGPGPLLALGPPTEASHAYAQKHRPKEVHLKI